MVNAVASTRRLRRLLLYYATMNLSQRWRPLPHTSDVIRHCAGNTVGQTLLIDGSGCEHGGLIKKK